MIQIRSPAWRNDGDWGPIFEILRAPAGGPKFEVTPLHAWRSDASVETAPGTGS